MRTSRLNVLSFVVLMLLYWVGLGPLEQFINPYTEEYILILLLGTTLWAAASIAFSPRQDQQLLPSKLLTAFALGGFLSYLYFVGIVIGNQPRGYVEGKAVAIGIVLMAMMAAIVCVIAAFLAASTSLKSSSSIKKASKAIVGPVFALIVIGIPTCLPILNFIWGIPFSLAQWNWLVLIYIIEEWSRALN